MAKFDPNAEVLGIATQAKAEGALKISGPNSIDVKTDRFTYTLSEIPDDVMVEIRRIDEGSSVV